MVSCVPLQLSLFPDLRVPYVYLLVNRLLPYYDGSPTPLNRTPPLPLFDPNRQSFCMFCDLSFHGLDNASPCSSLIRLLVVRTFPII